MNKKAGAAGSILALAAILIVCMFSIMLTHLVTQERILAAEAAEADSMRYSVLSGADAFVEDDEIQLMDNVISVYRAVNGAGSVVTARAKGSGGMIETVVGISSNGKITGVAVSDISGEIAGVGTQVQEDPYTSQYIGADSITQDSSDLSSVYIQAPAGADKASDAVFTCVQTALMQLLGAKGESL